MHSSQFTSAAQEADRIFFGSIVASCDLPYKAGLIPAAHVIVLRDENPARGYSVHMVTFPEDRGPVFLTGSYDLTRAEAFADWSARVADAAKREPDPMPA